MLKKYISELTVVFLSIVFFIVIFLNPLKEITFGDFGLMEIQVQDIIKTDYSTFAFQYAGETVDPEYRYAPFTKPFLGKVNGKFYIDFPPYFPLLNAPFVMIFGISGFFILNYLALIGSFWLINRIAKFFDLPALYRTLTLLLFGFGTNFYLYNIIFHEYPTAVFLIVLSIYNLLKYLKSEKTFHAVLFGFFGGLSLFFRLEMIFLILSAGLSTIIYDRKRFFKFSAGSIFGFILPFSALLILNQNIHGHILGLRYLLTLTDNPSPDFFARIEIIREMLFSKTRGLIYQSPFVLLSLALLFLRGMSREILFTKIFLSVSILLILLTSPNHGDHISPRYLFGTYPFLAISASLFIRRLIETKYAKILTVTTTVIVLISFHYSYKSYKWYKDSAINVSALNAFVRNTQAKNVILSDYGYALNLQNSHYQKTFFVAQTKEEQFDLIEKLTRKNISEFSILIPSQPEDTIQNTYKDKLPDFQIQVESNPILSIAYFRKLQ